MPFVKGRAKTGGRQKGGLSRIKREVLEKLADLGCDPIEGMVRLANDLSNTPELRGKMFSELARYIHPQRKAVELTGPAGGPVQFQDASPGAIIRSRIARIAEQRGA